MALAVHSPRFCQPAVRLRRPISRHHAIRAFDGHSGNNGAVVGGALSDHCTVRHSLATGRAGAEFKTDFKRHTVPYADILAGGPPKDGIPSIDAPAFVSVADADQWLRFAPHS